MTRGSSEHLDIAESRTGRARLEYVADRQGEARRRRQEVRHGLARLARINRISYDTVLAKGQTIIVYQVVDPTAARSAPTNNGRRRRRARRGKISATRPHRRLANSEMPTPSRRRRSAGPMTNPTQARINQVTMVWGATDAWVLR